MKPSRLAATLALALLPTLAVADDRKDSLATFRDYVKTCSAAKDRDFDDCLSDQVLSRDSYLGDIVAETAQGLDAKAEQRLIQAEKAFASYRATACAYDELAFKRTSRDKLLCLLLLTDQRIAIVLASDDFARAPK